MSSALLDLNDDLRRLRDEGFNTSIDGAHLVVRDIPYVNARREVRRDGILVTALELNGDLTKSPLEDHTIKFAGEYPCTADGQPIAALTQNSQAVTISERLTTQHSFSNKRDHAAFPNYYDKIKHYASVLCAQANVIEPLASPLTFKVVEPTDDASPFHYLDTASARAEINMITKKLAMEKVAIVGVGGTGSYVLDLLAKTPIREIHIFDGDKFSSHNAFRAPGAAAKDELQKQPLKVEYLRSIYSRMHRGIVPHDADISEQNIDELSTMSFVFLCMDAGKGKKLIVEKLEACSIPFIDVGMGLYATNDTLGGILHTVYSDKDTREAARARISFAPDDEPNEYDKNIQVADLNALNATLAVIRWKKVCGFYFDQRHEGFSSYTISSNLLLNGDIHEPS